jgi:hypothetical protein
MLRTLIALWGPSNVGKSETICLVYDLLLQLGARLIGPNRRFTNARTGRSEVCGGILELDGHKIGFASAGNRARILAEDFERLLAEDCTVIVCACHTRGDTVTFVVSQSPRYEVVWIEQERRPDEAQRRQRNEQNANLIIAEIRQAIERVDLDAA